MNKKKFNIGVSSTISSSILSLSLSVLSFSNLELNTLWHYMLAFLGVALSFVVFLIIVELTQWLHKKYIKRANISANYNDEKVILEVTTEKLYNKHYQYQQSTSSEYKAVLKKEISILYWEANKKINFIKRFSSSPTLKKKFVITDPELIANYDIFLESIKNEYGL